MENDPLKTATREMLLINHKYKKVKNKTELFPGSYHINGRYELTICYLPGDNEEILSRFAELIQVKNCDGLWVLVEARLFTNIYHNLNKYITLDILHDRKVSKFSLN